MTVPTLTAQPVLSACTRLAAALPAALSGPVGPLARRRVTGDPTRTAAWGDPPVTLQCGVARADLTAEVLTLGPADGRTLSFVPDDVGAATAFTTGELAVNVRITVPDSLDSTVLIGLVAVLLDAIPTPAPAPGS